jgi:hypothetical protein
MTDTETDRVRAAALAHVLAAWADLTEYNPDARTLGGERSRVLWQALDTLAMINEEPITGYQASGLIYDRLGLSIIPQTIYQAIKSGRLPAQDTAQGRRVLPTDVLRWAADRQG